MEPVYSPRYWQALEQAKAHHASSKTYSGRFLRPHALPIRKIILAHGLVSVLDYGCGKGEQYRWRSHADECGVPSGQTLEEFWGCQVWKFDPAYPPYSLAPPGKFDLLICTHVLGSIPIPDLGTFLTDMCAHARKVVYIAEKIGPVRKRVFSDPETMPRWGRPEWEAALRLILISFPHLKVRFATREKTEQGVITRSEWL